MNISKISRSLIVVIFIAFIIFLSFIDISGFFKPKDASSSVFIKIGYGMCLVALVAIYVYIKDKLYKLHVKRNLSFVYRYIYIVFVLIGAFILSSRKLLTSFSDNKMLLSLLLTLSTCFIIKKIIFNVSKSDILSVLAMFSYALIPTISQNVNSYILSTIFTTVFFGAILVFQLLIDELKQKGIKTKKYIIESSILGLLMGISTIFGVNIFVWLCVLVITFFITYNLDRTHINFPKKFMASLTQAKRESLYKIERININKLIVAFFITSIVLVTIYLFFNFVITDLFSQNILEFITNQIGKSNSISNMSLSSLKTSSINITTKFINCAPILYMCLFIYILFMEILAICLRRRYDTKSTLMKTILLFLYASIVIFNMNIYYFQPVITILLILIAIVNTSNIYLNREERIKMLVA